MPQLPIDTAVTDVVGCPSQHHATVVLLRRHPVHFVVLATVRHELARKQCLEHVIQKQPTDDVRRLDFVLNEELRGSQLPDYLVNFQVFVQVEGRDTIIKKPPLGLCYERDVPQACKLFDAFT